MLPPVTTTPFCRTTPPVVLRNVPPVLLTSVSRRSTLPAPTASAKLWLTKKAPLVLIVPPLSELIRPWLTIVLPLPLTSWPRPMVPFWPRIVMPLAIVKVLLPPSTPTLLPAAAPKTIEPLPLRVCVPSTLIRLPLSTLIVPLSTRLPTTRSRLSALARSRLPLSVTPDRKLLPLLVGRRLPLPVVLMTPDIVTPCCEIRLPAPATNWPPGAPIRLLCNCSVPPLSALMVPLLVMPPSSPKSVITPPPTSAEMMPLLTIELPLPLTSWPMPMRPFWPRIVTLLAIVRVLLPPSTPTRLLEAVAPRTIVPLPLSVWLPSKLIRLLLLRLTVPFSTRLPTTRSRLSALARSRLPFSVTPDRKLLPLLVGRRLPLPLVLTTPVIVTPCCEIKLPAPATSWLPLPPLRLLCSAIVPPLSALMVPLLVTPASSPNSVIVPPATSAEMVPLLTSLLPLPLTSWPMPMRPFWPRIVTPLATVSVLLPPSTPTRLFEAVLPNTMLPLPPSVWSPSKLIRLLLLTLTVPFSVMPPVTRPSDRALARSIWLPAVSVTPLKKLLPLLAARKLPPPLLVMLPPVMATPF